MDQVENFDEYFKIDFFATNVDYALLTVQSVVQKSTKLRKSSLLQTL